MSQPDSRPVELPKLSTTRKRVLIVEDDLSSANALKYLLSSAGWDVSLAQTLADGLEQIRSNTPDSVVLDLMLPDGNGAALLEYVRAAHPKVRVIVTTGVLDPQLLDQARAFGPVCLLQKTITMATLLQSL